MNPKTVRVWNDKPRLINGPVLNKESFRFLPGENQVPESYVKACHEHKRANGTLGTGAKMFAPGGILRLLEGQAPVEATPVITPHAQPNGKDPLPTSLEGFSTEEALTIINDTTVADDQLLINWGQADDREVVQAAIVNKLKAIGYGS